MLCSAAVFGGSVPPDIYYITSIAIIQKIFLLQKRVFFKP